MHTFSGQAHTPRTAFSSPTVMLLSEEPEHETALVSQLKRMGFKVELVPVVCLGVVHRYGHNDGTRDFEMIDHHIKTSELPTPFFEAWREASHSVHTMHELEQALHEIQPTFIVSPNQMTAPAFEGGADAVKEAASRMCPKAAMVIGEGAARLKSLEQAARQAGYAASRDL